jgi:hypothetical protein
MIKIILIGLIFIFGCSGFNIKDIEIGIDVSIKVGLTKIFENNYDKLNEIEKNKYIDKLVYLNYIFQSKIVDNLNDKTKDLTINDIDHFLSILSINLANSEKYILQMTLNSINRKYGSDIFNNISENTVNVMKIIVNSIVESIDNFVISHQKSIDLNNDLKLSRKYKNLKGDS